MKAILLLISLLLSTVAFGQKVIDMEDALSNVKGHLVIDGNTLQLEHQTKDQIIITGKDLVIRDRSSFMFNNIILQLTGDIIIKGEIKTTIIDSYIFCKSSKSLKSEAIIESTNFNDIVLGKVAYIKSLPEDAVIWIYNAEGKRVFKGTKKETSNFKLPISRYDVKVVGQSFKDKVLFYN